MALVVDFLECNNNTNLNFRKNNLIRTYTHKSNKLLKWNQIAEIIYINEYIFLGLKFTEGLAGNKFLRMKY